ncbi:MAG: M3 family peptidase, partial [Bacteroidales bacterium]|nr:M3 family peptidase [Bacteroidales bacterium]
MNNPLLQDWDTPFGTPPFKSIETAHFQPAIEIAIRQAAEEIKAIAENINQPGFENTIAALDRTGTRLGIITSVLFNLNNAETNKELQAVVQEVSPLLTRFSNDITLNEKLFLRIKHLYESRENLNLNREQIMLLEKSYRNFMVGGAGLKNENKSRFRKISEELSLLSVKFEENILEDTNSYELHLTDINDLAGLPEGTVEMSSMEAQNRGKEGWIFTLHAPSYVPFMKYSQRRDLREKIYKAYTSRAFHSDKYDNRKLAVKIANLRLKLAKILGFRKYS